MKILFLSKTEEDLILKLKGVGVPPAMQHTGVIKRIYKIVQRYLLFGFLGGLEEPCSQYKKQR